MPTEELPAFLDSWHTFLAQHRERLRGEPLAAGDPLAVPLIPSSWRYTLDDGTTWPERH